MGYLTPFLIRNDSFDMLNKEPEQVIDALKDAMNNRNSNTYGVTYFKRRKWYEFWKPKKTFGGADCNPIESLGTRHADEASTIVFYGNTWIDLSRVAWGKDDLTKYVESCVKIAEQDIRKLKKMIKEKKNETI